MTKHAFLSASSAHRWTRCLAAPWREKGLPDEPNSFTDEGTKAHILLEQILTRQREGFASDSDEMLDYVFEVAERVRETATNATLLTEQQLDISAVTSEPDAYGTADVVIVKDTEIIVRDFKYGYYKIEAENNEQLLLYAAGALEKFDVLGEIEKITLAIDQPRVNHVDEWCIPVDELKHKLIPIHDAAAAILSGNADTLPATPGATQCKFCKVRGSCQELRNGALSIVADNFVDLDKEDEFLLDVQNSVVRLPLFDDKHLATCVAAVDMIETWCKAVRGELENRLCRGDFTDARYKLVKGRLGRRRWSDERSASAVLEKQGYSDVYDIKLKTVAQLAKEISDTTMWDALYEHIYTPDGAPVVVSFLDKRPALQIDKFTNLDN